MVAVVVPSGHKLKHIMLHRQHKPATRAIPDM